MNGFDKLNYSRRVPQQLLVTSIPQEQIITISGKSLDKLNRMLKTLLSLLLAALKTNLKRFTYHILF